MQMTVNVEDLIRSLGQTYEYMLEAGILPYRTKPTGAPGSPNLGLEMAREGVFCHSNAQVEFSKALR